MFKPLHIYIFESVKFKGHGQLSLKDILTLLPETCISGRDK